MNGLIHNKVEFVSKLMSTDEDHESSLTPKELYDIYKKVITIKDIRTFFVYPRSTVGHSHIHGTQKDLTQN